MKLIEQIAPGKSKLVQSLLVITCTLLPWSATAIDQGKLFNTKVAVSSKSSRNLVEKQLVETLMQVAKGNNQKAMETVDALIRTAPNFKLAHLIRGDLLSAQARALDTFGNPNLGGQPNPAEIQGLREEAKTRINYYFSNDNSKQMPNIAVQMGKNQQHLILIDTVKSRLFLYKKSSTGLQYISDHYITIGKNGADKNIEGDKRTPLGLYFAGNKIRTPLSEFYGYGAYPLNYPNELDLHKKKTGYGIWLHGTSKDTYSRPPRASDGCVVLSNPDLKKLAPIFKSGNVPTIISDNIEWVDNKKSIAANNAELKTLNKALNNWRKDWISQNTNKYLNHYSKSFFYSKGALAEWSAHKRRVQAGKPSVKVEVSDVSMFSYPAAQKKRSKDIVVVDFDQFYQSPTLKNKMRKRQYWQLENNQWKIIYEGAA